MGYSFMHFEKIKTMSEMAGKYKHNYRIFDVKNADKEKAPLNEELLDMGSKDYCQCFNETIKEHNIKISKRNILALEIVTTFSREDRATVDIEKWKADNKKWLEDTFNVGGNQNVKSIMFHGDETGNVHIHAFVVPIDERGVLNASRFIDGREKCRRLQDSYGELMKREHNLDRGLQGSVAKHNDIKKYYAALNQTISDTLEKPDEKESIEHYYDRAAKQYQNARLNALTERNKMSREIDVIKTKAKQKHISDSLKLRTTKEHLKAVDNRLTKLEDTFGLRDLDRAAIRKKSRHLKQMENIKECLDHNPDRERMKELFDEMNAAIRWNIERMRLLEKEKDEEKKQRITR